MSRILRSTLAVLAVVILGLSFANATTYWISTSGSDGAAGTSPSTAFATFHKADSVVVPGDTVRVLSGTYNTTVQTYTAGSSSARITWISDTKWGTEIVGSANSGNGNWEARGDYVTVQGFDITGSDIAGMVHFGNGFHAVGNRVHDIGTCSAEADGITEWPYTLTGTVYDSNWVYNIANGCSSEGTGLYCATSGCSITSNVVFNIGGQGNIIGWHGATNMAVSNNITFNGYYCIIIGAGDSGMQTGGNQNSQIANNTASNCSVHGIDEEGTVGSGANANTFTNNLVFNNGVNMSLINGSQSGTVTVNPSSSTINLVGPTFLQ